MPLIFFKALPFVKEEVTLALESGVDGLIVPDADIDRASSLARCVVLAESTVARISLGSKKDEQAALALLQDRMHKREGAPAMVLLASGWEVIPVENLLAAAEGLAVEANSLHEAKLAAGVLERGVETVVASPGALPDIKKIVAACKHGKESLELSSAVITRISQAGMGHRVCVDTMSLLESGQGMLVGNSAAFTFLVNAESEHNEYVAARPFRVNAGGVHAYALMPGDRTSYLEELAAGDSVLIVDKNGESQIATVGRIKVEKRPMLLIEAEIREKDQGTVMARGGVFLQNAETIRLVSPEGRPVSVVELKEGDSILCRFDVPGRHFGMRITEDIREG